MPTGDPWLTALRQQAAITEQCRRDLEEARREGFKALHAELRLDSVERAYHRLLTDAPRSSAVRHLRERIDSVHP